MPGLSKVIVLDPDVRAARQIQLGFRREGIPAVAVEVPRDLAELPPPAPDAGLWIVGGAAPGALGLVRRARRLLELADIDAPIVFAGRGVDRLEAEDAGADEVLLQPAYLRDVVTVGRLLYGQPVARRGHLVGNLADTTTVLSLVRAFAAVGRSAVLTLIRGLRRGEVRFYHGEVTSAQVGLLNGQAALHQLLLWTDARFDYRYEDIVRRQQIPLDRDELYADAERFLEGVRESSGRLSPAMVLEQDVPRLTSLGKQIPLEVFSVLRMFDGHRVLADVLEDSPYRVFETLRVAQLALEAGLLRQATKQRPRATWRAVLALEEWLVGVPPQDEGPATAVAPAAPAAPVPEAVSDSAPIPRPVVDSNSGPAGAAAGRGDKSGPVGRGDKSGPVGRGDKSGPLGRGDKSGPLRMKGSRRKRKKWRTTPAAGTPTSAAAAPSSKLRAEIDWGALIPREVGAEVGTLAGVVPAAQAAGEITLPAREKLEELTSAAQRERLFSVEMTVFFDDGEVPEAAAPRAVPEAAVPRVVLEVVAPQAVPEAVAPQAVSEAAAPQAVSEAVSEAVAPQAVSEAVAPQAVSEVAAPQAVSEAVSEAVAPQAVSEAVAPQTVSEVAALLMVPGLMAGLTEAHETTRIRSPFAIAKANAAAAAAPTPPAAAVAAPAPVAMAAAQEAPAQEAPAVDIPAPVAAEPPSPAAPVAVEPPSPAAPVAAEPPSPTAPAAAIPEPESGVAPPPEPTVTPTPTVATPSESATATAALKFNAPPPAVETPEERARRDAEETAALEEMYRAEAEAAARAQAAAAAPSTATAQAEPATTPVVEPTAAQAAPAAAQPQMPPTVEPPTVEPPTVELPTVELPATDPAAAAAASAEPAAASAEPAAASAEPPRAPQNEPPIPNLATESPDPDSEYPSMLIDVSSGAPAIELLDETSDGIIRQMLATAETAPTPRRPLYEIPVDDRPEDTTGEIVTKTGQRAAMQPQLDTEPSILVADLAEMHTAGSAQTAAPTPVAARTAAEGSAPAAKVFSETEEDFFRAGQAKRPTAPPETFADLDEGYKPVGFWARLLGRKRKR